MTQRPLTPPSGKTAPQGLALLGAFCLFLATIEYLIPKPLPFIRLGITNLPLLLALDILSPGPFALLVVIKVIGQALISGTLFSYIFLFSLTGTTLSALTMYLLRCLLGSRRIGLTGLGIAGALISNISQLALARLFIFGPSVIYIAPPFLAAGLITGAALGLFCESFTRRSRWYAAQNGAWYHEAESSPVPASSPTASPTPENSAPSPKWAERFRMNRAEGFNRLFTGRVLFIAGLLIMPAMVFNPSTGLRLVQFLFFWFLAWLAGKRNNPLITILIIGGITAFNLLVPYGRVLLSLGTFRITGGALEAGLRRGITLEALVMLSRLCIRQDLRLPGPLGELIGESFRIFGRIMERKHTIRRKYLMADIDRLMIELSAGEPETTPMLKQAVPTAAAKPSWQGIIIPALAVLLAWLPWLWI